MQNCAKKLLGLLGIIAVSSAAIYWHYTSTPSAISASHHKRHSHHIAGTGYQYDGYDSYYSTTSTYPSPLNNRKHILLEPAVNAFEFQERNLIAKASMPFKPIGESKYAWYLDRNEAIEKTVHNNAEARQKVEHDNLTPEQVKLLEPLEAMATGDAAYEAGKILPPALRAYTAGAVAFNHSDFPHAVTYFTEAQATNDPQQIYHVWATFMLGRSHMKLNMPDKAKPFFILTRELVAKGAPDPLGLAVASYGEEARLALDEAGGVLGEDKFDPARPNRLPKFVEALRLYALQAQTGSVNGLNSLHILCKEIKNQASDFTLLMQDETARRMFLAYIRGYDIEKLPSRFPDRVVSSGIGEERIPFLQALLKLFPAEDKEVADQLAAAAFDVEDFELANRYASQTQSALSYWVRAKLALHSTDKEKAAEFYDEALKKQITEAVPSIAPNNKAPAYEQAVLTLARGQFVKAAEAFNALNNSGEASFISGRIFTMEELIQFSTSIVQEHARLHYPSQPDLANPVDFTRQWAMDNLIYATAYRLMRVGRNHEALAYLPSPAMQDYIQWLDKAQSAVTQIGKAEALYHAAMRMRSEGASIMGTELADLANPDAELKDDPFITQAERERLAASHAESMLPHSYRRIATAEALQAAELVPAKSQAFAAILCHATGWMRSLNEDESYQIYQQYVKRDAIVPWATHFGHHCPEPDFAAARYEPLRRIYVDGKHIILHHRAYTALACAILLLLASTLGWWRFKASKRRNT